VYVPADDNSRAGIEWLADHPEAMACRHHAPFGLDATTDAAG
jgi:hypothetical protein